MEIGHQIRLLRKKNKISPKKLVLGLCSERTLNYIEGGTELPDKMLADMLIQRLGKSPDKLELIISKEIYQLERMQDLFEEALERGNRKKAEYLLEKYAEIAPKSNTYRMFYYRSRAYLAFRLDGNLAESQKWIKKALDITLPGWMEKPLEEYLISTIEVENLLAYAKLLMKEGAEPGLVEAESLLLACRTYIDEHILDGEEHVKVSCKCADLLAEIYLARGEMLKVGTLCEKAFDELRDFGILYYMQPLLEKLVLCEDEFLCMEKKEMYKTYQDVLNNVYKRYEEGWHFADSIFKNCCQRTYYMDYELIRGERLAQGFTQEQLIEGIYENPESLSRVESGKSSPGKKTFAQLFERLGIEKGRYNTFLATESFEVLEMKKELNILISSKRYEEAKEKLEELKNRLDLNIPENIRVICSMEHILRYEMKELSIEEMLDETLKLLRKTYRVEFGELYRVPMDQEIYLLNQAGVLLYRIGKNSEAERLFRATINSMKKSKICLRHRFRKYSILIKNLAKKICSKELARENIKLSLECGKLRLLHMDIMIEACALIDDPANLAMCRELIREVFYFCDLSKNKTDQEVVRRYFMEKFGTDSEL